ncbi:MAG: FAD-dependent oxidoreductase [Alphaproteobacteria bacterium]|nr:FAD-dependent oxidoreductase [Alphaproteobacteria bacterium]
MSERKTGVYLCSGCGIGEAVEMEKVAKVATAEYKAPHCVTHGVLCGDEGVAAIKGDLEAGTVNQVVVGACSPRVMADRFAFDNVVVLRANLREMVAWSHPAGDEDTLALAEDQIRMAMSQTTRVKMPEPFLEGEFSTRIMVVGGGFAGLSAAREAARAGHEVLLIERSDKLGGQALGWSKRMPHRPPYRDVADNDIAALAAEVQADRAISVRLGRTVAKTSGMPGKFVVDFSDGATETVGAIVLATGWRPYDPTKLGHLGYGASPDVVTNVQMEALLATGKVTRKSDGKAPKAVVFAQCAGSRDPDHLPYCSSVCCGTTLKQAIQLIEADPEVMAYVVYEEMRTPGTAEEFYRVAQEKGVIFVKGKVKSVGGDLKVTVADALLGEDTELEGVDMVVLATGMVPNSTMHDVAFENNEYAQVQVNDDVNHGSPIKVAGYKGEAPAAAAAQAKNCVPAGAPILNLQYRQGPHIPMLADGFNDSHYICFPYETRRTGIYACGPVRRPMDMGETAEDAAGAVMKAIQVVRSVAEGKAVHPRVGDLSFPRINLNACTKCKRCTVECPFGAIDENEKEYPEVNPTRCRRCGTCMGACPVRTISFDNYSVEMISQMIKAVKVPDEFSGKPRIAILACENDAYPAIDMAGLNRTNYSAHVRVVPVRCLGSVSLLNVSDALSAGYDGVILMGCKSGDDYQCHFVKGSAMAQERMSKVGETLKSMMLETERVAVMEISIAESHKIGTQIDQFVQVIEKIGFNPFKGF